MLQSGGATPRCDFFQFCLGVFGGVLVRVLVLTNPDSKASRRSILVLLAVGATIRSRTHTLPCTLKTDRLVAPPHASRNSQAACTTLEANWCVTNLTIPLKSNVQAAAYLSKSLPFWAKPCTTKLSYLSTWPFPISLRSRSSKMRSLVAVSRCQPKPRSNTSKWQLFQVLDALSPLGTRTPLAIATAAPRSRNIRCESCFLFLVVAHVNGRKPTLRPFDNRCCDVVAASNRSRNIFEGKTEA